MAIVTYDGSTLATISRGHRTTVSCANKEMADNVVVKAENDTGSIRIFYDDRVIASLPGKGTATLICKGKTMKSDVIVVAELKILSEGLSFYSNLNRTCSITGLGTCTDADIVMPDQSPKGDWVIAIGQYAFNNDKGITSVEIPASVEIIDYGAFWDCDDLITVTFGEDSKLTTIGENAFYGCQNLKSIRIPDGVTTLGDDVFGGCTSLTTLNIPKGLEEFSLGMIEYCDNLETITVDPGNPKYHNAGNCVIETEAETVLKGFKTSVIPAVGVKRIGHSAFVRSSLTSINIPSNIVEIGPYAFDSCTELTTITFSEGSHLETIGYYAFQSSGLTSIVLPDSVKTLNYDLFRQCAKLTSVVLPSNITKIPMYMFDGCSALTTLVIPDSVVKIDLKAFNGCTNLGQVVNGVRYVSKWAVSSNDVGASLSMRSGIIGIADGALRSSKSLQSVVIPSGVKYIGADAFEGCSALTSVDIPDSVIEIGDYAFGNTNLPIVGGVRYADNWLVGWDYSTTSISVREGTVGIGNQGLENIFVSQLPTVVESVTLPSSIKYMGRRALANTKITSITLPSSIVKIDKSSFAECELLTTINVPWSSSDARNADAPWGAPNATVNYNYTGD